MPIQISGASDGNTIDISPKTLAEGQGLVEIRETGSHISIADDCVFLAPLHIISGPRSRISVGSRTRIGHLFLFSENDATIHIGEDVIFNGNCRIMAHEPAKIEIGNGCLFASDINVMASDMHSIVSLRSGKRINHARDIKIGNRVWIGDRAAILKGAGIGDDSVVGYASVVNKTFRANSLLVGAPAKVVKSKIAWRHDLI